MSRRTCIPSNSIPAIASYAAARAAARSGPRPVTASTRPPVVTPSAIPAGNTQCSRFFGESGSLSDPRRRQNRFSDHRGVGVAGGGGDDGAGGAVGDVDGDVGEAALGRGEGEGGEVRAQQRQDRLGLRVAEADVVLDEARAVGGQHQPGVEHADVRRAGGGEVVEDRLDERRHQLVGRVRNRRRARRRPSRRCSARCRPRRCACGPGPGAAPGRPGRRTGRAASTPGRASAPRGRTARW